MGILKKDGSLNIKYINSLPLEEHIRVFESLTDNQKNEYYSNIPLNESHQPIRFTKVNYSLEDELAGGAVLAKDFIRKKMEGLEGR